jgi:hypothetical protein
MKHFEYLDYAHAGELAVIDDQDFVCHGLPLKLFC